MSSRSKPYYTDTFAGITKPAAERLVRDKVKPNSRWVLVVLIMHRHIEYPNRQFKCSIRKIRHYSGFGFTTILNCLRELEKAKIVEVVKRGRLNRVSNEYRLNTGYLGIYS